MPETRRRKAPAQPYPSSNVEPHLDLPLAACSTSARRLSFQSQRHRMASRSAISASPPAARKSPASRLAPSTIKPAPPILLPADIPFARHAPQSVLLDSTTRHGPSLNSQARGRRKSALLWAPQSQLPLLAALAP